jgi:hypothetical protein
MHWNRDQYLASWPKAVPYPYAIQRSREPVPNRSSIDWPQSQWAPLFLPPGSPSVQPYRYPENKPLQSIVPQLNMAPTVKYAQKGPAGDTVATPHIGAHGAHSFGTYADAFGEDYGGYIQVQMNPSEQGSSIRALEQAVVRLEAILKDMKKNKGQRKKTYENAFDVAVKRARAAVEEKRKARKKAVSEWDKAYDAKVKRIETQLKELKASAERQAKAFQVLYLEDTLNSKGRRYAETELRQLEIPQLQEIIEAVIARRAHIQNPGVDSSESEAKYLEDLKFWIPGIITAKQAYGSTDLFSDSYAGDCGCGGSSYAGDCGCSGARMNPDEEESFIAKNKWLLLGAVAVGGYIAYSQGMLDRFIRR